MTAVHPNPAIRGKRVYLRPLEREDIELTVPAINDREIAHFTGFAIPVGKVGADRFFEEEVSKKHGESAYFFAICELGSAEVIGECGFHDLRAGMRADVGIFMLPGYVGRGFGTDAMNALVDFGFWRTPSCLPTTLWRDAAAPKGASRSRTNASSAAVMTAIPARVVARDIDCYARPGRDPSCTSS